MSLSPALLAVVALRYCGRSVSLWRRAMGCGASTAQKAAPKASGASSPLPGSVLVTNVSARGFQIECERNAAGETQQKVVPRDEYDSSVRERSARDDQPPPPMLKAVSHGGVRLSSIGSNLRSAGALPTVSVSRVSDPGSHSLPSNIAKAAEMVMRLGSICMCL